MKKLFLISLLIGNVAFAKVGSLVTGALVGGAVGYVAGKSGNSGETKVVNNQDGNIFKCNCKMVCRVESGWDNTYHRQIKLGKQIMLDYRPQDTVILTADKTKEDGCELIK